MPKAGEAKKRKAANGYKLAEPLPLGEVLKDLSKKEWKLGASIGRGGFGEIYEAKEAASKGSQYPYVIKIEPHGNGPLFVEMHFYMRNAKQQDVDDFKKKKGLKTFGMPVYLGSGSHEYNGEKYRFIVMEKFGSDIWKIYLENNRVFPATTVFKIAVQMLDVLEYIHERGYVHADLKGANILMGLTKETQNKQCYLVDFGLATKFSDNVDFKPNPKKAHDGTIEYLSRDAHLGVQTRRGDLEILAYNIIHWLGGTLPWEKVLADPNKVQKSKEDNMSNVSNFLKSSFGAHKIASQLVDFLKYLLTLKHNTKPDYQKIRKIFISGLDSSDSLDKPLKFGTQTPKKTPNNKLKTKRKLYVPQKSSEVLNSPINNKKSDSSEYENKEIDNEEDNLNGFTEAKKEVIKKKMEREKKKGIKKKAETKITNMDGFTESMREIALKRNKKVNKKLKTKRKSSEVLNSPINNKNARKLIKNDSELNEVVTPSRRRRKIINYKEKSDSSEYENKEIDNEEDNLNGFTEAKKEVIKKKMEREKKKGIKKKAETKITNMDGFTESMREIALKRNKKVNKKLKTKRKSSEVLNSPIKNKKPRKLIRNDSELNGVLD